MFISFISFLLYFNMHFIFIYFSSVRKKVYFSFFFFFFLSRRGVFNYFISSFMSTLAMISMCLNNLCSYALRKIPLTFGLNRPCAII